MYGLHSSLAYDVARMHHSERIARAEHARIVNQFARVGAVAHPFAAIRRLIGAAIVGVGRSIEGGRAANDDAAEIASAGLLHLAR